MYAYLMMDDFVPAALIGEDLARSYPQSSRAGTAGAFALFSAALGSTAAASALGLLAYWKPQPATST